MRFTNKIVLFVLVFLLGTFRFYSQDCLLDQPVRHDLVQDYADVLSDGEEQRLRAALIAFADTTSNQLFVVTVNSLCGYDKATFTYTLGEKWGVGQQGKDNGVVIMIKPHGSKGDRHTFIATGYGLEGVLPDAVAKRIVENEMIPRFKQQDFYEGIENAVVTVMSITSGEFSADEYVKKSRERTLSFFALVFILGTFFVVLPLILKVRRYASSNGMTFWTAWFLMNASRRSHGGSWGNFSSGGGSFGGFGGGSFGGGGAGGSW